MSNKHNKHHLYIGIVELLYTDVVTTYRINIKKIDVYYYSILKKMRFEISYEHLNGEPISAVLYQDGDVSIDNLLNSLPVLVNRNVQCWIYYLKTQSRILCQDDTVLNLLIRGIIPDLDGDQLYIIFRENNASPNSTPLLSTSSISGCSVSTIQINYGAKIANQIEPFTQENTSLIDRYDMVAVPSLLEEGSIVVFNSSSIISFIKSELYNGTKFFDICINVEITDSTVIEQITFDKNLWTKYLIRGNAQKTLLLNFFASIFHNSSNYEQELIYLHQNENLFNRLKIFIYDLIKFNAKTREHFNYISIKYPSYYFTTYHFTEDEIEYFLSFPTSNGLTCKDLFDIFIQNKFEQSGGEICTSHDIAPFMFKIFNVKKNFDNDKKFLSFMKKFKGLV